MNMIRRLRIKLTLWFVLLVMTIYAIDGMAAFWLLNNSLTTSVKNNLMRLCQEIIPAVEYKNGKPTLSNWMQVSIQRHNQTQATIQLFDANKILLESYGPKGIDQLQLGKNSRLFGSEQISVYSNYISLPDGSFVQAQVSSSFLDGVISSFMTTEILRGLLILVILSVFGWFYSGKAVDPIVKSLKTLRTFVDDAGHELNTPVALIENSIETIETYLLEHNLPTDELQIIQRASTSLKNLSLNLLLLAKMEQPDLALRLVTIDIASLVTDVINTFAEKARFKRIELRGSNFSNTNILADEEALIKVFNNLIENALRYTAEGGQINVFELNQDHQICIAVRDTGCGIPKDCLPYIFDRFYRVDKARSRWEGGCGLGLSIVKVIIEAHNGSVEVESKEGEGSTFYVTLPMVSSSK